MNCSIEYKNKEDLTILTRIFKGIVNMTDVLASWNDVIKNRMLTQNHKGVISDYREATLQVEAEDLVELAKFFSENINVFRDLKLATVIDSPKITIPMLFKMSNPEIISYYFSTLEAANNWIKQ